MGELWRSRQWRKLLNLIDHLPMGSFYNEARGDDEELAQLLADQPVPEHVERMSQWSHTDVLLAAIYDLLGSLLYVDIASNSKQGSAIPRIDPFKRPVTKAQLVREDQQRRRDLDFMRRMENPG